MLWASFTVRFAILERFQFYFRRLLQYVTSRFKKKKDDQRWGNMEEIPRNSENQPAWYRKLQLRTQNYAQAATKMEGANWQKYVMSPGGRGEVVTPIRARLWAELRLVARKRFPFICVLTLLWGVATWCAWQPPEEPGQRERALCSTPVPWLEAVASAGSEQSWQASLW